MRRTRWVVMLTGPVVAGAVDDVGRLAVGYWAGPGGPMEPLEWGTDVPRFDSFADADKLARQITDSTSHAWRALVIPAAEATTIGT